MREQLDNLSQIQSSALDMGLRFGPKLLVASLILVAGYYAGRWLGKAADSLFTRLDLDVTARHLLVRMVHMLTLGLFAIMALQNLGVELLPLIAGLGVAGAGLALAMQGVLSNLAAGLTILFTRPFRVGEYIAIVGVEGQVEVISLFNTILRHADRSQVVIPNRKIVGEILHNYGQLRQLDLSVGVAYDSDIGAALASIEAVLKANPRILREPAPQVQVAALADSSVNIAIRPWVNVADFGPAGGEITRAVLDALRSAGVAIPFPQREVRLINRAD